MELFQLKNYQVIFMPQTMMITEFKAIRDKNNDDNITLKEMTYLWFFADIRSDFQNVIDEDEREEEIKKSISLPENWKPSQEIKDAIEYYKTHSKTASSGLYYSSLSAAQFIEKMLKNPSELLAETDARGNPLYKLGDIIRMLKDIPDVMEKLHKAKQQVIKEIEEQNELKGNRAKAMFEEGI